MAPINPNAKKRKATASPSSAKRGAAKRSAMIEEGVDRISSLPNSILGCILALLSVTEAVRMTRLSTVWRQVFSSPDYRLDCINDYDLWRGQRRPRDSVYLKQSEWRSSVITSLLDARHHSIRRFIVQRTLMSEGAVSRWISKLSQSGVIEELVLKAQILDPIWLPHSIFRCSSLRSLSLSNCRWPRRNAPAVHSPEWTLPQVTELTLSHMDMTMEAVKDMLRRCSALLSLSLGYPRRFGILDLECKNLLSLTKMGRYVVRIVDTPKLERLLWWPLAPRLTFEKNTMAKAPRMHTLGIFQHCPIEEKDGVVLEHVRTIALFTNVDHMEDLGQAIRTLRHLPQLETLHLKMMDGSESDSSKNKPISFEEMVGSPILCLENSVKKIVLKVNNLVRQKLAFTNFLLEAAKSLECMIIYNKRMAGELLPPERRGSSGARIVFGDSSKCTLQFETSASNYKLADPFMA